MSSIFFKNQKLQELKALLSTDIAKLVLNVNIECPVIPAEDETNLSKYDKQWDEYISTVKNKSRPAISNPINVKILAIADTHGNVASGGWLLNSLKNYKGTRFDIILFLGDIPSGDINILFEYISANLILGVYGNHDSPGAFDRYNIEDLHKKIICTADNIWIAGIEGSVKYNNSEGAKLSHAESIAVCDELLPTDILVSHDTYYHIGDDRVTHKGLAGISKFLYENHVPYHIHGHTHQRTVEKLSNGTVSIGVYGAAVINIQKGEVSVHNLATG